jgi:hypothetical protein
MIVPQGFVDIFDDEQGTRAVKRLEQRFHVRHGLFMRTIYLNSYLSD